jgi:hypothetical protein
MRNELIKIQNMNLPTHKSKSLAAHPCNLRFAAKHMLFLPTLMKTAWIMIDKGMIRQTIITIGLILITTTVFGQSKESYDYAFNEINKMLKGESQLDFKKAVFLTENAFYSNNLDYNEFCQQIDDIEIQLNQFMRDKKVVNHPMGKQFAIFSYMMEPSKYNGSTKLVYDFEDLTGQKDWTKMFVTKLLNTKTGNCHSLPYLYKILAEETKAEAYLALAPNHLYIKHKDDKGQWVNVELTNGTFPTDGWVISSLSITTEAIKAGTYMESLSLKESVTLCLYDLALGYQFQFGHDDFGLKCCDTLLNYFPKCIYTYMVKSEILAEKRKSLLLANSNQINSKITELEKTITGIYDQIDAMGYKDMPKEQYEQWVKDAENERLKQK